MSKTRVSAPCAQTQGPSAAALLSLYCSCYVKDTCLGTMCPDTGPLRCRSAIDLAMSKTRVSAQTQVLARRRACSLNPPASAQAAEAKYRALEKEFRTKVGLDKEEE